MKIRRALISVSDKSNLLELARGLKAHGVELVATGRSAEALRASSIPVRAVEDMTQTPEILGGRVKTLSYQVFSGILYRRGEAQDEKDMAALGDAAIDLVVVNFYPFEAALKDGRAGTDPTEFIDIGGPSLVRAAAKNSKHVAVLTDPSDYGRLCSALPDSDKLRALSKELAAKAWRKVAEYDEAIARHYEHQVSLRYGENPHQSGQWIGPSHVWPALTEQALSYSNFADLSAGSDLMSGLLASQCLMGRGEHAAIVLKHAGPCGVAIAATQESALRAAWDGDPVSAFGGVVLLSHPLTKQAVEILSPYFFEVLAAPGLGQSPELAALLAVRKKLKATELLLSTVATRRVSVAGGELEQQTDRVTDAEILEGQAVSGDVTERERRVMLFAMHCAASLKSNAIAVARESGGVLQLTGTGQGQPNRIEALTLLALPRAKNKGELRGSVIASDGFFPFPDSIEKIAQAGIDLVVQPGGSLQDPKVIEAAREKKVRMIISGRRHFRH